MSRNTETPPVDESEEAVFVAYQEPTPMMRQHIEQIRGVTRTLSPGRGEPVEPVTELTDEEREEFEAFKRFRAARAARADDGDPDHAKDTDTTAEPSVVKGTE